MSASTLSSGPACDGKKFFIEVTGIQHPDTQNFLFYDQDDMIEQEYLAAKQVSQQMPDTTIYSWDWTPETEKRNVWLNIAGDKGPIKLPLYNDVSDVPRQIDEQYFLLHAVLPLTLLPTYNSALTAGERLAPIRNGYLYVIYHDRIWREIEIRQSETGMSFRDTDLYRHREGRDKPFRSGLRQAAGKPLQEIWLPAKENNYGVHVRLVYSEVQWSGAYLNFLEADIGALKARSVGFHQLDIDGNIDLLQASSMPEMRLREPERELALAEPISFSSDLSGAYLPQLFKTAQQQQTNMRANGRAAVDAVKFTSPLQLEYGVKQAALNELVNKTSDEESLWQAHTSADYLTDAKARKLRLIALQDPLFELRHHAFMVLQVSACLFHILEDASQQKYFQSAELVQRFVVQQKLPNGQDNPNHKHLDSFDYSPIGVFQRTLRNIERRRCQEDMVQLQQALGRVFDSPATAAAVRDITSQDRGAVGAYRLVGNAIQALSLNLAAIDPLQDKEQPQNWPGRSTVASFYTKGAAHPLHALLYPPAKQVPLETAYAAPPPINDGSGLASCENIARWAGETLLMDDQMENLDQAILLAENSADSFGGSRRMLNTADGILSGFYTAMLALQSKASAHASLSDIVESIDFKAAYLDNIRLAKVIDPDNLGQITYIPTSGEPVAGAYVLGVHSKKAGLHFGLSDRQRPQTQYKRTGILQDQQGKLLALSNKRSLKGTQLRQGASARSKADLRALVVPDDNPLTQIKVEQLAKEADLDNKLKPQSKAGSIAGQVYTGLGVPYFIVVLEVINLQRTMAGFNDRHGAIYRGVSSLSATVDLGVALISASNFLTQETGRIAQLTTSTLLKLPPGSVRFLSLPSMNLHLERNISSLKFAGIIGGTLTTAVAVWDTSLLIAAQDNDAAAAMAMVAIGTGLSTFGSLYTATFLLSPLGWIGLAIALVGFSLYMLFKDSPMETWLKNGPFGNTPDRTGDYKYLQKPEKAWQHFMNLILNIRIKTYPLHSLDLPADLLHRMEGAGATHGIWLTSNLMGLNPSQQQIRFHARQAVLKSTQQVTRTGRKDPVLSTEQIERSDAQLIYKHKIDNGYILFYRHSKTVPRSDSKYKILQGSSYIYDYRAHFHTRAQLQIGEHTFPTPPLSKEEEAGSPTRTPSFKKGEYWWANEFGWEQ